MHVADPHSNHSATQAAMLQETDHPAPAADKPRPISPNDASHGGDQDNANGKQKRSGTPFWKKLVSPKVIIGIVVASVLLHGVLYLIFGGTTRSVASQEQTIDGHEITLGEFGFKAGPDEQGQIEAARFKLHLSFLPEVDAAARLRLTKHRFRVEQDIEQLMRQAHGGDFQDPMLIELKRQLQEQINGTLGVRAVADVIITDLRLTRVPDGDTPTPSTPGNAVAEAAGSLPWLDD